MSGEVVFLSGGLSYGFVVGLSVVVLIFNLRGGSKVMNGVGDDTGRGVVRIFVGLDRISRGVVDEMNTGGVVGAAVVVVVDTVVVNCSSAVEIETFSI